MKNISRLIEQNNSICESIIEYKNEYSNIAQSQNVDELLDFILKSALNLNASDIHLDVNKDSITIQFRINAMLRTFLVANKFFSESLIRFIKLKCNIDISRTMHPLEGRFSIQLGNSEIDCRLSIIPTVKGEKLTIRLLNGLDDGILIDEIGFTIEELDFIKSKIRLLSGFILICGPTGSGKTTTLCAILNEINNGTKNIITIEDPVEYFMNGIVQVNLSKDENYRFSNMLRFSLRQDPDILMIGEIRDKETADISLKASITGHLVFSTIHTRSAIGVIERLVDLGMEPYIVADAVTLIINQRLIRKLCSNCKELDISTYSEFSDCDVLYKAKGCDKCLGTGYSGRKAIFEILNINSEDSHHIRNMKYNELKGKFISLNTKIIELINRGETSVEEGFRYIY